MSEIADSSRREFLSTTGKLMAGGALASVPARPITPHPGDLASGAAAAVSKSTLQITDFHFGASLYPELLTRDQWNSILDHLQQARMNCVRVSESSWGNLETASGRFNFRWLHEFLDDLEDRNMRALLGTGSYIPPQWLVAAHPDILVELHPGVGAHPMARHAPCLNHPVYRNAVRQYILTFTQEFRHHPTVIGWQMGNEEEGSLERLCHNPACVRAWRDWLKKTYHSPEEFNRRLNLVSWGMKVDSLDAVPQPGEGVEESGAALAALTLAHRHFRRDVLFNFFLMQAQALREGGAGQWILTDWNTQWHAVADDPLAAQSMDIAGLNEYQHPSENSEFWMNYTWQQDMHRSCYGRRHFLSTENRFGVIGGTSIEDPAPTREQFLMWGLQAAAMGSCGLLYWSGNRWRGGHWPHWGGLFDWSGHPEPDFEWAADLGKVFAQWGRHLIDNPVQATAAILTDFDQRIALSVYPHIAPSNKVLPESFDAFHRLGIGVDALNLDSAASPANLKKYALVLIPAATSLDDPRLTASLHEYTQGGGTVVITPFTSYMDKDGVFRGDGFAANLRELTGSLVRTIRWMGSTGSPATGGSFRLGPHSMEVKVDPEVAWKGGGLSGLSPVGLEGYCELLDVDSTAEVIADFKSAQAILDGRPAATRRKLGSGRVVKLAFWPGDNSLLQLLMQFLPQPSRFFAEPPPRGGIAVPRSDNSLFIINTTGREMPIHLARAGADRLSGASLSGAAPMRPYEVWWLA